MDGGRVSDIVLAGLAGGAGGAEEAGGRADGSAGSTCGGVVYPSREYSSGDLHRLLLQQPQKQLSKLGVHLGSIILLQANL